MNVVKGLAAAILCFLLFISLSAFGAGLVATTTILNEDFTRQQVQKLDIPDIVREIIDERELIELPSDVEFLRPYIYQVFDDYDSWIHEELDRVIDSLYAYFNGERDEFHIPVSFLEVRMTLNDKVWELLKDNINEVLPELLEGELADFIEENLDQYRDLIPGDLVPGGVLALPADELAAYLIDYLDDINLELVMKLSPQVNELVESLLRPYIDQYVDDFVDDIPSIYVIDEEKVGQETMEVLETVRRYLDYFQTGFYALIGVILLLIICVFLVYRDVRNTTLALGITLAFYGLMELASTIIGRSINYTALFPEDVPLQLQEWATSMIGASFLPLLWFSIGALVVGIGLIVVSFIARRREIAD